MAPLSSAYHLADGAFLVPRCTHDEFIPTVMDLCRKHDIRLIVPTIDTELPAFAKHRKDFADAGVTVAISSPEVIAIGGDKTLTHEWLTRFGLPTVRQHTAAEVLSNSKDWTFPCIVKPRAGSSSIGVAVVASPEELRAAMQHDDDIVQSIAPGKEYTIDFLADSRGRCVCTVPRKRLETRAGEVSKGVTVRSEPLQALATRVCDSLPGPLGSLCVQIFRDDVTGEMNVIEINPRFGGGYPLSHEAGAHFTRWIIEEILGRPCSAKSNTWRNGVVMLRYDDAVFVDAANAGLA
jgi:carbamoyl-phosphate synthase large subunit